MEEFINYLLKEFQLPADVVCHKVDYIYSNKNTIDKKSNRPITHNIITVKIDCYDKEHHKLASISEKFVNGHIQRPKSKKLINISPDELNNKFGKAKAFICSEIQKTNSNKVKELNEFINDLNQYCGNTSIIPNEFINEPAITPTEPVKNKQFEF